jgi:molybdopterin synthase catalytic subunit
VQRSDPPRIGRLAIVDGPLDVGTVEAAVRHHEAGAVSVFVGVVRDHDHGKAVGGLSYSAHPTAEAVLAQVADEITARHEVLAISGVHRIGDLAVGDLSVVVAASAVHRGAAIDACHDFIDTLKTRVPIWKHQSFTDGSDEWVGTP